MKLAKVARMPKLAIAKLEQDQQSSEFIDNMVPTPKPATLRFLAGRSLVALGAAALIFLGQLLIISHVQYESAQFKASETLRFELANGTAPVGQVDSEGQLIEQGSPVAMLMIEKIGVQEVVLEGTSSAVTVDGPGHRRDTVLPGQAGISVIYGRQSSYTGVFSRLGDLEVGDKIQTITGQGESSYTVSNIRKAGDEATNQLGSSMGRLTLVSTAGIPFFATDVIRVEATLDGSPKQTPNRVIPNRAIADNENALASNLDALTPLIFMTQLLILVLFAISWLSRKWGKVQSWIAGAPAIIFLGGIWSSQIIQLLPNLI
jgi:LPXTG-site transpeptidase (sortase) family protein